MILEYDAKSAQDGPATPFDFEAFLQRMKELGWNEGQNIRIDIRDAQGNPEKLASIMKELVDSKVKPLFPRIV